MTSETILRTLKSILAEINESENAVCYLTSEDSEIIESAIKALDQEPCEDEYIKVPKKALKYRTAGMVAYNAEWLKNHFDMERALICGAQEPKIDGDVISREALLKKCIYTPIAPIIKGDVVHYEDIVFAKDIINAEPIKQEPKTGHWRHYEGMLICSECGTEFYDDIMEYCGDDVPKWCLDCGCRMSEVE